jgi:hypothetical protein
MCQTYRWLRSMEHVMQFEELTPELKEKALACETPE